MYRWFENFACSLQRGQGANRDHERLDSCLIAKQGGQSNNIIYDDKSLRIVGRLSETYGIVLS